MAPKKRAPQKTKLEDVTGSTPVTKKSRTAGKLDTPIVEKQADSREELFKRRQAKKSGTDIPSPEEKESSPGHKEQAQSSGGDNTSTGSDSGIWVNRAPVLTLWVSVVAQRQGFSRNAGLTFGKAIAGLLAQSKGKSIGVFNEKDKDESEKSEKAEKEEQAGVQKVEVFGMHIKGVKSGDEVLAVDRGTTAIKPNTVQSYLSRALGARLEDAESALKHLAEGFSPDEIGGEAYKLYEQFRPSVPSGQQGWGKKGLLEPDRIKNLRPDS